MSAAACQRRYDRLRRVVDRRLAALPLVESPGELRNGCRYALTGGGKRIRALLVLLACEAAGGTARQAIDAGVAVEIMHNFTLVHDDIMDNAASRRGQPTVHTRWNLNTALLVGDTLMGAAYASLLRTRLDDPRPLLRLFTSALVDVCEGQALDLAFGRRADVRLADYFAMVEKKTGRLIEVAAEIGGIAAGATRGRRTALRRFGHYLGRAFQIQDDLLDAVADEKRFGKTIGGDIIEGKKTFLLLTASERARGADRQLIADIVQRGCGGEPDTTLSSARRDDTVAAVIALYRRLGVIEEAERHIRRDTATAVAALGALPHGPGTAMLRWLAEQLVHRAS